MVPEINLFMGQDISKIGMILGPETDLLWLFLNHQMNDLFYFV